MANSINTNYGAQVALQNLNATNRLLETTQNRVNTGLKVSSAKDNGAIYAIAQSQRSDVNALNAVSQSLNRGQSAVDVALAAGETVSDLLTQLKETVVSLSDTAIVGDARSSLEKGYESIVKQIDSAVESANFNGLNLLSGKGVDAAARKLTVVSGLATTDRISIDFLSLGSNDAVATAGSERAQGAAFTVSQLYSVTGTAPAAADIDTDAKKAALAGTQLAQIDKVLSTVNAGLSALGTGSKQLQSQSNFVSKLQDAMDAGIGNLVDADLAKESSRLQALQTKQQLGVQALSIANSSSQILLGLFR